MRVQVVGPANPDSIARRQLPDDASDELRQVLQLFRRRRLGVDHADQGLLHTFNRDPQLEAAAGSTGSSGLFVTP
jgi:hypothetical protein